MHLSVLPFWRERSGLQLCCLARCCHQHTWSRKRRGLRRSGGTWEGEEAAEKSLNWRLSCLQKRTCWDTEGVGPCRLTNYLTKRCLKYLLMVSEWWDGQLAATQSPISRHLWRESRVAVSGVILAHRYTVTQSYTVTRRAVWAHMWIRRLKISADRCLNVCPITSYQLLWCNTAEVVNNVCVSCITD